MNRQLTYLASPYSHPDRSMRVQRFEQAAAAAAHLMGNGALVFSPICHTHPIAEAGDLPKGWDFWEQYDRAMLGAARELIVLKLAGWEDSVGVQAEIKLAKEMQLPIAYMEWNGDANNA